MIVAGEKKPNSVESGLVELAELPPAPERKAGGGGGTSEFVKLLEELHGNVSQHRKPISMRRYGSETGAKAARNVLRQRLGRDVTVSGHEFHVRLIDGKYHLIAVYDPTGIVDGAAAKHVEDEKKRLAGLAAKKKAKDQKAAAEKANAPIPTDQPSQPRNLTQPVNA